MDRKGTKIKRHGSIYGRNSGSWTVVIAIVFGIAIFSVVGWNLYTPIYNYIMTVGENKGDGSSTFKDLFGGTTPSEVLGSSSEISTENTDTEAIEEIPFTLKEMQGVYLAPTQLANLSELSTTLNSFTNSNINLIMVDGKNSIGEVPFKNNIEIAQGVTAADTPVFDGQEVAKLITESGFVPAAQIFAFKDSLAPLYNRDISVHYQNTDVYWLDNSPSLGGKPWLNPFTAEAQQYIIDLATALCNDGFKVIFVDGIQFPSGEGLELAGYGADSSFNSRKALLIEFTQRLKTEIESHGATMVLITNTSWQLGESELLNQRIEYNNNYIYGGSPKDIFIENLALTLPTDATTWQQAIENTTDAQAVVVAAYNQDGGITDATSVINNIKAATSNEFGYLLFNPQGSYKLN